jgi:hypothetical protein
LEKFHKYEIASATVLKKIRSSYGNLCRIKAKYDHPSGQGSYDVNDDMNCIREKTKLATKLLNLVNYVDGSQNGFKSYISIFSDWFKSAQAAFGQPKIFTTELAVLKENLLSCEKKLNDSFQNYKEQLSGFSNGISTLQLKQRRNRKNDQRQLCALNKQLEELDNVHKEIVAGFEINKNLCQDLASILKIEGSRSS